MARSELAKATQVVDPTSSTDTVKATEEQLTV